MIKVLLSVEVQGGSMSSLWVLGKLSVSMLSVHVLAKDRSCVSIVLLFVCAIKIKVMFISML